MTESASTPRLHATFAIYVGLVIATTQVGPGDIPWVPYSLAGLAGLILVALACLGRIWTSVFIAGHKDEKLVTAGPYALCRHPLYACSMVGALGIGLTSRSALLCGLTVLVIVAMLIYAAAGEEQFLESTFPEEYRAYVLATPNRFWPRLRARPPLPERIDVRPAVFWKAFLDAGAFILLWVLVELAAQSRMSLLF